jgi:5,10-methylenetetrahydromethanopterin reductase
VQRIGMVFSDRPHIRDYVRLGRLAEDLGYDSIWVTEPRMARDAITGMAVIAATTHRIKLGTAVINNLTFATLDGLAPGRIILGVGAYWDPLAWNQGIVRRKPLTAMREYVDVVRRLFNCERVTLEGEIVQVRDLELDAAHAEDLAYGNVYRREPINVPIYLGPSGDKMLELTGEIADGAVLNAAFSVDYVRHAVEQIRVGAERAGRDLSAIDKPKMIYVAVDRGDESWLSVKRKITRYLGQQRHVQEASGLDEEELRRIGEAMGGWPPRPGGVETAMELVPDSAVRRLMTFGSPAECREQIREFLDAGADYPILMTEQDDVEDILRLFAPETWK